MSISKSFSNKGYLIVKNAISKELAFFLQNYLVVKEQVLKTFIDTKFISPFNHTYGFIENNTQQVPGSFCTYGDVAFDTLLLKLLPLMEKKTGLKLNPSYSYTRNYKKGDELKRHKDRFNCEISTTIFLGGDKWDIFLEPSGKEGKKGLRVSFELGDMLIYKGHELEHWREPFKGKESFQVFLHYNNIKTKNAKEHIFDKRVHVGLPSFFRK
tara:strand:+ start:167 stop:802 length:636 start_codon:yes stop_codon:yes gene_type:complete